MLKDVLDRVKTRLAPSKPPTRAESQDAAQQARESRATLIVDLQAEVRSLQQSITDLSNDLGVGSTGADRQFNAARLASLETALGEKQRELAQYQGRI